MQNRARGLLIVGAVLALGAPVVRAQEKAKPKEATKAAAPAGKATPTEQAIRAMFMIREFRSAAISPDGTRVAWVESLVGQGGGPSPNSAIYAADVEKPEAANPITASAGPTPHEEGDIAWSPDGKRIAFLSDAAKAGQLQLYVENAGGGKARQLTHVKGDLSGPAWSPDGKTIALLYIKDAPRAAGPLAAVTRDEGVVESKIYEQRLTLVDVVTGRTRQISPSDLYVYEFDWAPDGKKLVATATHGNGDDNWYVAELYVLDAGTGAAKSILKPKMQIGAPRWSPDKKSVAFIGGLMSDEPIVGGDVYVVPAGGGEARDVTPGMKGTASSLDWLPDSREILFCEYVDGESGVAKVNLSSGAIETIWKGSETISPGQFGIAISLSRDRKISATVRQSFDSPPEVWAGPIGAWKPMTKRNAGRKRAWGETKSLRWKTDIGEVQGWLTYPLDYHPSKRYPMVVRVHGGPSWAVTPAWPTRWSFSMALPANGYFVLQPNPRGSYGRGEEFTRANVKDFGGGDLRDILAGVDEAVKTLPIDERRIGITGWSYGGYMTMWAVTQTNRFRAAVAGAGIANWLSYTGENAIDQWMVPFFGATVYDDPAVYEKSAPIAFIKNAKTPTLVLVGDSDGECPPPQSYEFWHALKTLGVETQLVIYPNEGHLFTNPAHGRDVIERAVDWFNRHMR
jgi:dipeptidyl aminopeptidase/acylaminoacyl peptidase